MKDRVSKYPGRSLITPEDGSAPFYATITRADEPTQPGDPMGKVTFLRDETAALFGLDPAATPNDVFRWLGEWGQANWKLLAEYNTAGAYTFTVPDDVDELGVFILGGGSGGRAVGVGIGTTASAPGGRSGGLKQIVLKKGQDFLSDESIPVVVGAGGLGGVSTHTSTDNPTDGGTSAFKGITTGEGQTADSTGGANVSAPFGFEPYQSSRDVYAPLRGSTISYSYKGRNIFDPTDTHVYCGAGGFAYYQTGPYQADGTHTTVSRFQSTTERAGGHAGAGSSSAGGNATAPGDGGGGAALSTGNSRWEVTGGNGADGLVLVYGRKVV